MIMGKVDTSDDDNNMSYGYILVPVESKGETQDNGQNTWVSDFFMIYVNLDFRLS